MSFLSKFKITHKGLYWGLIFTFALLYLCVGFVSTLHSITFFGLANTLGLAILLGVTYEIGQASVLFSILMTKNKDKFLPWALMFLLTALQVTANVYASFKFMATSGSNDWQYWQKSILIGVQAENAEMYQVIISWIAGALLPIVALGMTALVAQNIKMMSEENEIEDTSPPKAEQTPEKIEESVVSENKIEDIIGDRETYLNSLKDTLLSNAGKAMPNEETPIIGEGGVEILQKPFTTTPAQESRYTIDNAFDVNEGMGELLDKEAAAYADVISESKESVSEIKKLLTGDIKPEPEPIEVVKTILTQTVVDEPPKKPGRPPKKEPEAESKKEKELLPKEDARVPRRKRTVDPLKKKTKIKKLDLKELHKPSVGDKVLEIIEKQQKDQVKESIIPESVDELVASSVSLVPPEIVNGTPYVDGGVEVLDAKAVTKPPDEKKNPQHRQAWYPY